MGICGASDPETFIPMEEKITNFRVCCPFDQLVGNKDGIRSEKYFLDKDGDYIPGLVSAN